MTTHTTHSAPEAQNTAAPISTAANNNLFHVKIDVVKTSWFWLGLSVLLTIPGLVFMVMSMMTYPNHAPLKLGIDFTGGMMTRMAFVETIDQADITKMNTLLEKMDIQNPVVQLEANDLKIEGNTNNVVKGQPSGPKATTNSKSSGKAKGLFSDMEAEAKAKQALPKGVTFKSVVTIRTKALEAKEAVALNAELKKEFGDFTVLEKNQIGPTLAQELFVQAGMGLLVTFALIVVYLSIRFQMDYAIMALIAMFHDAIFLVGTFSMLGWLFNIEVNSMFVTAVLTVIGFSVHDTIVVFDRVRENLRRYYTLKLPIGDIINISVNQTFARSINTSLTALITLTALYFFGGDATKNFLLALILGIAVGTYSSIFVASTLLAWWRSRPNAAAAKATTSSASAA
jgi:preprotein translocase subunit SecF